jgi:radical SAM superfamily enzyme YgiQ (UPF0313 family)
MRVQFPFIVGFPDETEASVAETLALAKRLRAMSPGFETMIFYFAVPGIEPHARGRGARVPAAAHAG